MPRCIYLNNYNESLETERIITYSHFNVFSTNQQINVDKEDLYHILLPLTSHFNKMHYYPLCTTTYLDTLLETRR